MSWKSIVITGLLCVVASPVLAAPGLVVDLVRSSGLPVLDASGNWQWRVSVDPDETMFTTTAEGTGGALAIEIGMTFTGAPIVGATVNTTNFDHENFGMSPFGFGGNPADGLTVQGNQLFAALGSTFFTDGNLKEVFTVTTAGPSTVGPNLTTGVSWSGVYNTDHSLGGTNARVAQQGANFDTFNSSLTKTVLGGDANLNGTVNIGDFGILQANFNGSSKHWTDGDFNGTGTVNIGDFGILQANFNSSLPAPGGGSISVVPEPASAVLAVLSACAVWGLRRRNHS
jgi:hypothetical protein